MRHVWLFLILPLAVPSSESDAKNASRALRRIQGRHNGNVSDEQVAPSGTEPSPRLSEEGGRTLSRAHHRRLDRPRRAGPADAAATVTPAAPSPGCCWSFNADTKRYQFYPRPANQACVAPYKAAPCSGAPAAAPSPAAAAAAAIVGALRSSPPPPPPVVESTHQHQGHTKHQLPPPPPPSP